MNLSPVFLGTCLVCALGGAVAGTSLGSTPVLARADTDTMQPADSLPTYQSVAVSQSTQVNPDHYPLVTPRGTVAVADLADRGLYSQTRYRESDAYIATALASDQSDPDNPQPSAEPAVAEVASKTPAAPTLATNPLNLGHGPVQVRDASAMTTQPLAKSGPTIGHARVIKVNAAIEQKRNPSEPVNLANR